MALENKKLLDLANEADETKFKDEVSKLTDEEKSQLNKHMDEQIIAKREEKRRQEQLADDAAKAAAKAKADADTGQVKTFEERLRLENVEKAFDKVFSDMSITKDEEKQAIRNQFKREDDGSITVDNIVHSIKKAVVATNPDQFLNAHAQSQQFQKDADELQRGMAGNAGGNTRDEDKGKQYSEEARKMVADEARRGRKLSLEDAENYVSKGATRIIR